MQALVTVVDTKDTFKLSRAGEQTNNACIYTCLLCITLCILVVVVCWYCDIVERADEALGDIKQKEEERWKDLKRDSFYVYKNESLSKYET